MNKEQRMALNEEILNEINKGLSDKEIAEMLRVSPKRVQSIRLQSSILRKAMGGKEVTRVIDKTAIFEDKREIVGVPYVYQGHKYIDITGDIIDCGNAYKGGKGI